MWLWLIILIVLIVLLFFYYKRCKKFKFDSLVMINGGVGSGKSSLSIHLAIRSHKKAHSIWWRRTHIWFIFNRKMKNEEEPLLYSNIPLYENYRKNILYKYYMPLSQEHLLRLKRFNFKSVIFIDEASLVANSMSGIVSKSNPMALTINESLTLFLKLVRHELHGSYRNIFGSYPNCIVNTQSKNDLHYAFDRCISESLYITKSMNLPFFKLVYVRDLLLIDSVENNFNDDFKEDLSTRWFLMPKKVFKRYDSYCYSFLTDNKEVIKDICKFIVLSGMFEIVTFVTYKEILNSNNLFKEYIALKESEVVNNGQQENI